MTRRDMLFRGASLAGLVAIAGLPGCGNEELRQLILSSGTDPSVPLPPNPPPAPPAFAQPPVLRSGLNGLLDVTLNVQNATNSVNGQTINTRTYNGILGGPTLRVRPGDRLRVNLVNQLPPNPDENVNYPDHNTPNRFNTTNLHTHGLHVSPQGNSDNIFVQVSPGNSFQYEYQIPADHPAGTFWYHPHRHGSSLPQLLSGMGGALIVEGGLDLVPEVAAARDLVYLINELNINAGGVVPVFTAGAFPLADRKLIVNGQFQPILQAFSGEVLRLRVINGSPRTVVPFSIDNHGLTVLSLDGITLPATRNAASVTLASANRADVMIQCGAPGDYLIKKLVDTSNANGNDPEVILGMLRVLPQTTTMSLASGALPVPAKHAANLPATNLTRTLTFATAGAGGPPVGFPNFTIDGARFDPNVVNHTVALGSVEEWTLVNTSNLAHPFHIHVNPFQVLAINGVPLPAPQWMDTINIPKNGSVTIRHRFEDFTGLYVLHCHILVHEDIGMMQTVNVV